MHASILDPINAISS